MSDRRLQVACQSSSVHPSWEWSSSLAAKAMAHRIQARAMQRRWSLGTQTDRSSSWRLALLSDYGGCIGKRCVATRHTSGISL